MPDTTSLASPPRHPIRRLAAITATLLSAALVLVAVVSIFYELATQPAGGLPPSPVPPLPQLPLVQQVALPSIVIPPKGHAPIQALPFDGFDFQALDPQAGRLFITHPGPSAAKLRLDQQHLPPGTRIVSHLVVFDITRRVVVSTLALPDVHGVVIAPDLGRVYVTDVQDDRVYVLDARSLRLLATIPLDLRPCAALPCEHPDALAYDALDQRLFVSDNGATAAFQNLGVIDVRSNRLIAQIPLGRDRWGDATGHPQFDPLTRRLYVAVQPQAQPSAATGTPSPVALPPAQFVAIDPARLQVLGRVTFSDVHACSDPHGLVLDVTQGLAFTACTVTHTLMMIDLHTLRLFGPWKVVSKPDILRLDPGLHRLYVPGATGVTILDERAAAQGVLKTLGTFGVSKGTSHTIEVDVGTHLLYFPVQDPQGNPVLRILRSPA